VYDITSRESFNNLPRWIQDAREQASKEVTIAVVGNKRDLSNERAVPMLDASRFCQERDLLFMETSALTGEGVVDIFELLTRRVIDKIQSGQIDPKSVANGILADQLSSRKDSSDVSGGIVTKNSSNGGFFSRFFKFLFSSCDPAANDIKSL
jgi:Ras-related protein Rab-4B